MDNCCEQAIAQVNLKHTPKAYLPRERDRLYPSSTR